MSSMTGSRLLSALLSPSLLPGLMLSTVSQLGPGVKPQGVWCKMNLCQAKFISFSKLPPNLFPSSSWSSGCWFRGLFPSGWGTLPTVSKHTPDHSANIGQVSVGNMRAHTLNGQIPSSQGSHSKRSNLLHHF
nr:unnamed protein product [Mus musculus]